MRAWGKFDQKKCQKTRGVPQKAGKMKPKKSEKDEPQKQLFQTPLVQFLDMKHPLVDLAEEIDWGWFEEKLSQGFGKRGPQALPVRLVVGLNYLKHEENLSDEQLLEKWVENPYWQYFCGYEYFQKELPCDATSLTKWRGRLGKDGAEMMLQETLRIASKEKLLKPKQVTQVVVDTTAQVKNITYPTDGKLLFKASEKLVKQAKSEGLELRQTYVRVQKRLAFKYARYCHAKQFRRARKASKAMSVRLGRIMRDIRRKSAATPLGLTGRMKHWFWLAERIQSQVKDKSLPNKVYSLHEPHVACIAKGKAHSPYEFGSKVSVTSTIKGAWVLGVKNFQGNPYDGSTLRSVVADCERMTGARIKTAFVDKGYRGKIHWPEDVNVIVSGRKRLPPSLAKLLKRRQAIEPVIGHMKHDFRMRRNFLSGVRGDEMNSLLAGTAFNFRKLLRHYRRRLVFFFFIFWRPTVPVALAQT